MVVVGLRIVRLRTEDPFINPRRLIRPPAAKVLRRVFQHRLRIVRRRRACRLPGLLAPAFFAVVHTASCCACPVAPQIRPDEY